MRKNSYTPEEINLLKKIFINNTKIFIQSNFNRSWRSIYSTAKKLGLKRDPKIIKQEMVLGGIYEKNSKDYIKSKIKDRTWSAIRGRAFKLKIFRDRKYINKDIVKHNKETVNARYGVDYVTQLTSMHEKSHKTNMEKRGVKYAVQAPEVRKKINKKVQEKYGVKNVFQLDEVKEKILQTKNQQKFRNPDNKGDKKGHNQDYIIELYRSIKSCHICPGMDLYKSQRIIQAVNLNSDIFIISQALAQKQLRLSGINFFDEKGNIGNTGKNLEKFLNTFKRTVYPNSHKIKNKEFISVYNTEITQCYPGKKGRNDRQPNAQEIHNCLGKRFLKDEINLIKPRILFLMGKISYETFFQFIIGTKPKDTLSKYIDETKDILTHTIGTETVHIIPIQHASSANPRFNEMLKNRTLINKIINILES